MALYKLYYLLTYLLTKFIITARCYAQRGYATVSRLSARLSIVVVVVIAQQLFSYIVSYPG